MNPLVVVTAIIMIDLTISDTILYIPPTHKI